MPRLSLLLMSLVLGLGACSVKEDRFVAELTTADCLYATSCWDESVLNFYAWDSPEACEVDRGPVNAAVAVDCAVYDKKKARECIKALETRSCVDSDDPTDFGRPAVCDEVFTSCEAEDTDGGDGVDTDDTDA